MTEPWRSTKVRRPRAQVQDVAGLLDLWMKLHNPSTAYHFGGSWRRGKDTIGDLDIVVITPNGEFEPDLLHDFEPIRLPGEFQRKGGKIAQGDIPIGLSGECIHIDFWACKPEEVGAFLWFVTGPADLNVAMRKAAIAQDMSLSQEGLFFRNSEGKPDKTRRVPNTGTEAEIAAALGGNWGALLDPASRESWVATLEAQRPARPTVVRIPSTSGRGVDYKVSVVGGVGHTCSCPGFRHHGRCKHLAMAESEVS